MRLSLETRDVGPVTIVRCNGRIVTGDESESLRAHVAWLLHDRKAIVLHLGDVVFVDSSGLGSMVRSLTSVRQKGGELKLCNVPEHTRKILNLTNLTRLFDVHDSEESAIAAFYCARTRFEQSAPASAGILCVDRNRDVLAYLQSLLKQAGYEAQTCTSLVDSVILMRVTKFQLVLLGSGLTASVTTQRNFEQACVGTGVLPLGEQFSGLEAAEAASELLEKVAVSLRSRSSVPS